MRILDELGREVTFPGYRKGRLVPDRALVCCHEAVPEQKEEFHFEVVKEYPGGGREVRRIIDRPGIPAQPAWDEFEEILRYIPYTPAELSLATDRAADTDALLLDHELRLTILELGGSL